MKVPGLSSHRISALVALLLLSSVSVSAELSEAFARWNQPVEPFRIASNLYYVGSNELAAYLFVTPDGHILLDGGFEETAPLVRTSVETLGFWLEDVKILINSHGHSDHAGGLAPLKEWSGASLVASRFEAPLLEGGGEAPYLFAPVVPDRLIEDGESVTLGGTVLIARITAGHTPGCTTWTTEMEVDGEDRAVVFLCSVNALPEMDLLSPNPGYPDGRIRAFERSFELLDRLPCELFLGAHASFFLMQEKRDALAEAGENPFIDPELCRRHIAAKKKRLEEELERQRARRTELAASADE
jgi:metallo-beta-lactamase class B